LSASTNSMSAVVGQPDGSLPVRSVPQPALQAGEVLVRIHASGINPLDTKILAQAASHARQPLPAILGMDLAGVVEAVGAGVERFAPGDEV
jgi:NADPH2:quinone reductase